MNQQTISIIAGVISGGAYFIYLHGMWRKDTRPSKSSWWMVTVVWVVVFLSSLSLDSSKHDSFAYFERTIQIVYILGSLLIAISTIWRGQKEPWEWSDYLCAICVAIALTLYIVFRDPFLSMILGIAADAFAIIPTIRNAKNNPHSEHKLAWNIELFSCLIAVFGISVLNTTAESMALWVPIIYLVVVNGIIVALIYQGRKKKPNS